MATKTTQQPAATTTLQVPSEFPPEAVTELSKAINGVLADTLALYLKAKNFHWHVSGPHFRDYHLLFEEQATQLLGATDDMAERVRKIGGATLKSIGHIAKLQRIKDNDVGFVSAGDMLRELMDDNKTLLASLRDAHAVASEYQDVGTTSLLENWIDEAEQRIWFLAETIRTPPH
jgi:starvation-inducible DNA-binding protein